MCTLCDFPYHGGLLPFAFHDALPQFLLLCTFWEYLWNSVLWACAGACACACACAGAGASPVQCTFRCLSAIAHIFSANLPCLVFTEIQLVTIFSLMLMTFSAISVTRNFPLSMSNPVFSSKLHQTVPCGPVPICDFWPHLPLPVQGQYHSLGQLSIQVGQLQQQWGTVLTSLWDSSNTSGGQF